MILQKENFIKIDTMSTSYVIRITAKGDIENLYFGEKLLSDDFDCLCQQNSVLLVNTLYPEGDESYTIDAMRFEYSFPHRGDSRSAAGFLRNNDGENFDFVYVKTHVNQKFDNPNIAKSHGDCERLSIELIDKAKNVTCYLHYIVYAQSDVICRYTQIVNNSNQPVKIIKLMSCQLDIACDNEWKLINFHGAWCRERDKVERKIEQGKIVCCSSSGLSSPECNPFFMVAQNNADNNFGECYAFNLIYSANHEISVEKSPYSTIRITNGMASDGFELLLDSQQEFVTPESVLTYSNHGYNGVSNNMRAFVKNNIINCNAQVPIMINTWEGIYFDITQEKLMQVTDYAKKLGMQAVIIDDGWFLNRNDDATSLGDWTYDKSKFKSGIKYVSDYVHNAGLKFGIWLEPEMISVDSELYRSHSEWAIKDDNIRHIVGRGQYILDLTNPQVVEYIKSVIDKVVNEYGADYIKWDFNRKFAEVGGGSKSGEFFYRYTNNLYEILNYANKTYPQVVIEGCASGGGRFDLGIMCFCPIVWVSDNTNPTSRVLSQEGSSYGYPISVFVNHISQSPNHQTLRQSTLKSRADVAYFGRLGVQMDITKLSNQEFKQLYIKIATYKKYMHIIEDSIFYRLSDGGESNYSIWQAMDKNAENGLLLIFQKSYNTVSSLPKAKLKGLDTNAIYSLVGVSQEDIGVAHASGDTLMKAGFSLPQNFQGVKFEKNTSRLLDGGTALFEIRKVRNKGQ